MPKTPHRTACLTKRDAITPADHEAWSFAVCEKLAALFNAANIGGKTVALYNPIKSELDITPLLHALYAEGVCVALPVVESGRPDLSFYRFHSTLKMEEGAFGVMQPEQMEQVVPDIVIVPLVGFDRRGHRIGYGKGYYDATLALLRAENPSLLAIGVAFALQEVDSIPAGSHDMKLDAIVTEKEVLKPAPRPLSPTL